MGNGRAGSQKRSNRYTVGMLQGRKYYTDTQWACYKVENIIQIGNGNASISKRNITLMHSGHVASQKISQRYTMGMQQFRKCHIDTQWYRNGLVNITQVHNVPEARNIIWHLLERWHIYKSIVSVGLFPMLCLFCAKTLTQSHWRIRSVLITVTIGAIASQITSITIV